MEKKVKSILKYTSYTMLSTLILLVIGVVLYSSFEYTLIAEVRESAAVIGVKDQDPLAYGKLLFETRGCSGCHSIAPGEESTLAPNLGDIASRESTEYLRESIDSPDAVIVDGFQAEVMPEFGKILDETQVIALVTYLSTLK